MADTNPGDDNPVCRMCHCEGEDNRPLYFPCKCDGSIRYVHQDCLLQWLKIKSIKLGESKCELCGENYKFRKVYATGTGEEPPRLSIIELCQEIFPYLFSVILSILESIILLSMWVIVLPFAVGIVSSISTEYLKGQSVNEMDLFQSFNFSTTKKYFWHGMYFMLLATTSFFILFQITLYVYDVSSCILNVFSLISNECLSINFL